jgi:virginiamycin B lyase
MRTGEMRVARWVLSGLVLAKPNTIVRFDQATEKFQSWAIPGGGDIVRNMDVTLDGNPVLANSLTNEVGLVRIK